jgi:hypothetical protein
MIMKTIFMIIKMSFMIMKTGFMIMKIVPLDPGITPGSPVSRPVGDPPRDTVIDSREISWDIENSCTFVAIKQCQI